MTDYAHQAGLRPGPNESRIVVEWDWVYTVKKPRRLHAPAVWDDPEYHAYVDDGRTACGLTGEFAIPGLFSRLGMERCKKCCIAMGFPPGKGSPKNDDSCRPLVEERLKELGLET